MNQQRPIESILWLSLGLACGAGLGYMISELVVDRVIWGKPERHGGSDSDEPVVLKSEVDGEVGVRMNYADKKALDELVRPYTHEGGADIRIINESLAEESSCTVIQYFEDDSTFADEDLEIIDDPNGLFGPNIHLHFGEKSNDPDVVYVQNDRVGEIYEVLRMNGSYKEEVLGEGNEEEPEPKPEPKPKRNRRAAKPKPDPRAELTDEPEPDEE